MPIDYGSNNVTYSGNISVSGTVTAASDNFTNLLINNSSLFRTRPRSITTLVTLICGITPAKCSHFSVSRI